MRSTTHHPLHRWSLPTCLALAAGLAVLVVVPAPAGAAAPGDIDLFVSPTSIPAAGTTAYLPAGPIRLLDTRELGARPDAATELRVEVHGGDGVPADVAAAAVTLTATDAAAAGYVTMWGDGPRPGTSTLNLDAPGDTRANAAIVPVGADGALRVFTQSGAHLVIDLTGVFVPADTATAGRLQPFGPARVLDTRTLGGPLRPREVRIVDTSAVGVPVAASAVSIVLTGIARDAWFSAWPSGATWPGTSTVHTAASGAPASATSIVPVRDGAFQLMGSAGGHVVVDVTGWFTGDTAEAGTDGLFVPVTPARVLDTRGARSASPPLGPSGSISVRSFPFATATAGAVAINLTAVGPEGDGYMSAFATSDPLPATSTAHVAAGTVSATGALVASSARGVTVFSQRRTHLVIDVTGWFVTAARSMAPVPMPRPTSSESFVPAAMRADGSAARWSVCAPPSVLVDFSGAQAHRRAGFGAMIADLRDATGFELLPVVEGVVDGRPVDGTITVRWAAAGSVAHLADPTRRLRVRRPRIVWGRIGHPQRRQPSTCNPVSDLLRFVLAHEMGRARARPRRRSGAADVRHRDRSRPVPGRRPHRSRPTRRIGARRRLRRLVRPSQRRAASAGRSDHDRRAGRGQAAAKPGCSGRWSTSPIGTQSTASVSKFIERPKRSPTSTTAVVYDQSVAGEHVLTDHAVIGRDGTDFLARLAQRRLGGDSCSSKAHRRPHHVPPSCGERRAHLQHHLEAHRRRVTPRTLPDAPNTPPTDVSVAAPDESVSRSTPVHEGQSVMPRSMSCQGPARVVPGSVRIGSRSAIEAALVAGAQPFVRRERQAGEHPAD
ncbi:MAG: hypothetical protein R2713_13770 [Ilumatobacteraceae bacterium]